MLFRDALGNFRCPTAKLTVADSFNASEINAQTPTSIPTYQSPSGAADAGLLFCDIVEEPFKGLVGDIIAEID